MTYEERRKKLELLEGANMAAQDCVREEHDALTEGHMAKADKWLEARWHWNQVADGLRQELGLPEWRRMGPENDY